MNETPDQSSFSPADGPLAGCTVVVTRPQGEAGGVGDHLAGAGARVINAPAIEFTSFVEQNIEPVRLMLMGLRERGGWIILPSPTAVKHFAELLSRLHVAPGELKGIRLATVGEGSAARLQQAGLRCDYLPPSPRGQSLGESLPAQPGETVVIAGSRQTRPELSEPLTARGMNVQMLPLYAPRASAAGLDALAGELQAAACRGPNEPCLVLLTSPSAVDAICERLAPAVHADSRIGWIAIGPTTHGHLLDCGFDARVTIEALDPTPEAIVEAACELAEYLRSAGENP